MGNSVGKVANSTTVRRQETVLEAEKRDGIPRGLNLYIAEQFANAFKGKGTKDPMKILSNGLRNYSESPTYNEMKRGIKKIIKAGCKMLLDYTKIPVKEEFMPFYTGEMFNMNQGIYM